MKKVYIIIGVVLAVTALIIFNRMTSKKGTVSAFAEVKKGTFEISVTNPGELLAERSLDIMGPVIGQGQGQGQGQRGGGGQGHGGDMRVMDLKIQDIVPEGTIVKEGDYIAQIDRSTYDNTLKDELENLKTYQNNVDMKILDTAVTLSSLRDEIKNQSFVVEEANITLSQSKYEPPATIRKAETSLDKAQRDLEQKKKGYELRVAQTLSQINHEKLHLSRGTRLVADLQDFLSKFTITAPANGMVIYKKERNGAKRKAGSNVNPFDMVIATLPDLTSMLSKVYINEIDISKLKEDQKAQIKVDAFPDKVYSAKVVSIANIGEQLPNSDDKMFEVQLKLEDSDPTLRPSMTTGNKIIIKSYDDVVYIPTECVHTGSDSIPFVYEKNNTKQIVMLGESNEKNVIIEQGLEPGTLIHTITPESPEKFKISGEELIPLIRERNNARRAENERYRKPSL